MLNIKTNLEEERLTVALEGRLDTTTAPELESCLQESSIISLPPACVCCSRPRRS